MLKGPPACAGPCPYGVGCCPDMFDIRPALSSAWEPKSCAENAWVGIVLCAWAVILVRLIVGWYPCGGVPATYWLLEVRLCWLCDRCCLFVAV